MRKTYSECVSLKTWAERFEYLKLNSAIGYETFGEVRWLNQGFYQSREWKLARDFCIARDLGRDLAMEGFEIHGKILVHHINPVALQDLLDGEEKILLSNENLICVSADTHNALHFGRKVLDDYKPRCENDTIPWR